MDVVTMSLRLTGGASFPGKVGTVSATWPLAVLTADDSGVSVDLRSTWLKRMLGRFVLSDSRSVWWSARWEDLKSVDFGRRSIVLRLNGKKGCRFVTLSRRRIIPLIEELERHNVAVTQVKNTIGWFVKPG